jgi:hypothetical protein
MEDEIFFYICLVFVAKGLLIGSEFNFVAWAKHGKRYTHWYFNRESWSDYLRRTE